jgi:hypothetical protein
LQAFGYFLASDIQMDKCLEQGKYDRCPAFPYSNHIMGSELILNTALSDMGQKIR